jgi:hypothetical protein
MATIYEVSSGRVIATSETDPVGLDPSHGFIPGVWGRDTHYVKDGVAREYPPNPNPSLYVFSLDAEQWVDPRSIDDLKAAKNDAINAARAAANSSTFTFQGKQIAVDALSRSDIDAAHGAILMLQAMPPGCLQLD